MAFAGYKFGQVGARQVPYAYFLLGLTVLTVATDPEQAWRSGLIRTEEIFVGIICSLFVSTLVWPRYAREEFFEAGRATLKTVSRLVLGTQFLFATTEVFCQTLYRDPRMSYRNEIKSTAAS
jgi:uncharacterized membrane protein YccC